MKWLLACVLVAVIFSVSDAKVVKKKRHFLKHLNVLREFEKALLLDKIHKDEPKKLTNKVQKDEPESSGDDKRSDVNRLVDSDSSGSGDFGSGSGGSGGVELPQRPILPGGRKLGNKLGKKLGNKLGKKLGKKPGKKPSKKPSKKAKRGRNTSKRGKN